jgi:hypothetical protein
MSMDKKFAEIAALWAEWKSALMHQRSASFEQAALRAKNRRMQIEREIAGTPATTPLGGLIKLAVHEFNADKAASISSTYRALAAIVGRDPLAEAHEIVRDLSTNRGHLNSKPLAIDRYRMLRTHDAPKQ